MSKSELDEAFARRNAVRKLGIALRYAQAACEALYDNASGWAGEAEGARDAIDQAIKHLSGEPVD